MGSQSSKSNQDDFEEINIDFNLDTESSENSISEIFTKLEDKVKEHEQDQVSNDNTSPFISTELYNKIMNNDSEFIDSSPFMKTEEYKQIINDEMVGGNENIRMRKGKLVDSDEDMPESNNLLDDGDDDSSDSSDLLAELSNITLSSSEYSESNKKIVKTDFKKETNKYGYTRQVRDPYGLGKRPVKKQGKQNLKKTSNKKQGKQNFKKTSNKKQGKQNLKKTSTKKQNKVIEYDTSEVSSLNFNTENNSKKTYDFSETSDLSNIKKNYKLNNTSEDSETPYKVESSEINTSDINLVSVDSINGRRYIN
tara:strand:+ start:5069 stop:5995 length:927 start_codon:yes stop_codon:yes gene_type:complete